jgi:hypothetical protein
VYHDHIRNIDWLDSNGGDNFFGTSCDISSKKMNRFYCLGYRVELLYLTLFFYSAHCSTVVKRDVPSVQHSEREQVSDAWERLFKFQ